ncbi:MAG: alpha/beta hydrolase [Lachnospiraceae bacterium]|nr:alpha/beta hydrolase [Lachnospiraceae bacterium]
MDKNLKNGCVKIGDTDMYYVSFGNGEKKLVVLPGLSDGLATVKGKAMVLSPPYKKFFHDFTVYMFSRKNDIPKGYSIKDMADDQVEAMKNLGIERACVLGVSQGGMIAQCIAIRHPEAVERLILTVTAPYANEVIKKVVSSWIEMADRGDHRMLMVDTAEKMYSDEFLQKNRKYFPVIARFTKPSTYDRFLKNTDAIMNFDVRDELSKISCPTLIISGSDDKTVGNDAAGELSDGIAGSELFVYEGLGHGAFEEAKDFYDRVLEFCLRR